MRLSESRASLHARIIAFIAAILCGGALLLGLAAWQYASVAARDAYDKLLIGGVIQVAENLFVQGGVVTLDPPAAAFATLSAYDLVFYRVTDPRGVVVAGYEDLAPDLPLAEMRSGVVLSDGVYQGQKVRIAAIGKQITAVPGGEWAEVVVAQTVRAREALAVDLTAKALGLIGVMSLLALVAGAFSVRIALAPLTRIEREIAARRPDDLRPIQHTPPLEVRALITAIDAFMRRLSERMSLMQRFIADAAHQLRTPLAALDAQAEMLSAAPEEDQAAQIARLRKGVSDLGRLTSQLLDHAMIAHRTEMIPFQMLDLNGLAQSVLSHAVPLSLEREVSIAFVPGAEAVLVMGDAISLREALSNLIHNALTHGATSRLTVRVGQDGDGVFLAVCDDGPGIPATERERLLAPFETGAADTAGSGLGLAIASDVAKAHGGAVSFSTAAEGFCVRLTLQGGTPPPE
ncbi:sensor histidine kinase [Azorhizobium sp. AG788]|uniref:sensor histidine kinase n=1 Tax=Azorhizobium sp. AG788 TaxID=2183897 RepID=UPI003138F734